MQCPSCSTKLVMSERSGIEIDYCPDCRGIWLDRGELDKILEKNRQEATPAEAPPRQYRVESASRSDYRDRDDRDRDDYRGEKYHKRRKSFLEELFD